MAVFHVGHCGGGGASVFSRNDGFSPLSRLPGRPRVDVCFFDTLW